MRAQRERGIRLPAWAVPEAVATIRGHAGEAGRRGLLRGLVGLHTGLDLTAE